MATLDNPQPSPRRGLVIVGGGALGAYSFGCLKAFEEAGLVFQVVAGTSAGSLNAVIWSTGELRKGEQLWSRMSPETTYDLIPALKRLPSVLRHGATVAMLFVGAVAARARGHSVKGLDRPLAIIVSALFAGAATFCWRFTGAIYPGWVIGLVGGLLAYLQIMGRRSSGLMLPFLVMGVSFALLPQIPWLEHQQGFPGKAWTFGLLIGGAFLGLVAGGVAEMLFALLEGSAFSSGPLAKTVGEFLRESRMNLPTYVTVAVARALFDPDRPTYSDFSSEPGMPPVNPQPTFVNHWVPKYIRIDTLTSNQTVLALLASAALPFGIVPSVDLGGDAYVDGGVADNCPILPLLGHELDEIFVLTLAPGELESGTERQRCAELLRLVEIDRRPKPTDVPSLHENSPPTIVPYRTFAHWPLIRTFGPEKALGGALAFMTFSPSHACRLIELGLADTRRALNR